MKNKTQGFTLIELLIVIAIIGILAAVLIPNLLAAQKRAYDTGAASCAKSLQTALATLQIDTQSYALASNDKAGLIALQGAGAGCSDANIHMNTVTATTALYGFNIGDVRGSKTYAVSPSNITSTVAVIP
jgi:type IV pilus assembly protein PilA